MIMRSAPVTPQIAAGLMVVLDTTVTAVAMPTLVADLNSSLPVVQWVTTGYLLALVAVLPTTAWLINRLQARRVFLIAVIIFTAASALATAAWNIETLIIARIIQGLGGGLINPTGQAIALRSTPPQRRGRVMSLLGLPVLFGPLFGPILSGWLIDQASWRLIFAVNLPVGVTAIVLAVRLLPRQAESGRRTLDLPGLLLLPGGAVAVVLGLTLLAERGITPGALAAMALGVLALAAFALRSLLVTQPLVSLRLLRGRNLAAGCGVLVAFGAAYFGSWSVLPNYVQAVRGGSALLAGSLAIPQSIAVGVTMQVATRLVDRVTAHRIVITAISVGVAGAVGLAAAIAANAPYGMIMVCLAAIGLGSGGTLMPTMTIATRDLDHEQLPAATTLLGLLQQLASSIGIAVLTAVFVAGLNSVPVSAGLGLDGLLRLRGAERTASAAELGRAVAPTYLVVAGLMITALAVAVLALRRRRSASDESPITVDAVAP